MSWFGDIISDVGGAVKSVGSSLVNAAGAPITASWQATRDLAGGRPLASFKATLSGMGGALKPVGQYAEAIGEGYLNFGKGVYKGTSGLVQGDLGKAAGGYTGAALSGVNVTTGDALIQKMGGVQAGSQSLTGYSGLAYGYDTKQNYLRSAATTAVIGTGAAASAFGGTAAGSAAYTGVAEGAIAGGISLLEQAGTTVLNVAKDAGLGAIMGAIIPGAGGGTSGAAPYASPGSATGTLSTTGKAIIGAIAIAGGIYLIRKVRK